MSVLSSLLRWFGPRVRSPAAPALALIGAAVVAVVFANSGLASSYESLRELPLELGAGPVVLEKPVLLWINDGLMAIFFLLVGLEVKRELMTGALSSRRHAALPVAAALGGMLAPALVYAAVAGRAAPSGWGVPMATDIAFALGVLALLRSRVPTSLVVFLTAFAVADDIGAVLVIAFFYTQDLALGPLGLAIAATFALFGLNRLGVRRVSPYLILGAILWVAVLKSGVHATIAGLVTALAVPHGRERHTPLLTLEHGLAPYVAWVVLPTFAFANAGVALGDGVSVTHPVAPSASPVGFVFGKLVGVGGLSMLAVRLGWAELPDGVRPAHLFGVGLLGGIGFTMAIFIAGLAFVDPLMVETAKAGVLLGFGNLRPFGNRRSPRCESKPRRAAGEARCLMSSTLASFEGMPGGSAT